MGFRKVLVTGGAGFVGTNLIKRLTKSMLIKLYNTIELLISYTQVWVHLK